MMKTADPLAQHLVLGQTYFPLAYLASPYSPRGEYISVEDGVRIKEERFQQAAQAARWLMENQKDPELNVFSPIIHSHILHLQGMRGDWTFWQKIDTDYLFLSDLLIVLTLPGWKESTGVQAEIKIAKQFDLEVLYLHKLGEGKYKLRKRP